MDRPSWTPFFQPSFDDDPINTMQTLDNPFDHGFDQTYDWAEAPLAPLRSGCLSPIFVGSLAHDNFSNSSTSNDTNFPSTAWSQYLTGYDSQIPHMGDPDCPSQPELSLNLLSEPFGNFTIDGTVSGGHQQSQAFCIAPEPLALLQVAQTNVVEKHPDVLSNEYLSTLTPKQLEEFKKKATELLEKSHKKSHNAAIPCPQQPHQRPTRRNNPSERVQKSSITCEYPGCRTTFSRKKDQLRHFRLKHGNSQSFRCPIVGCRMGEGHEFQRSDKLRDHLSTKSLQSATWLCILPGCSETRVGKEGILDHLGTHELDTRTQERVILRDYGFLKNHTYYEKGYLGLKNICTIYGCPFGTNSDDVMKSHLSIPHDGPLCPCPITSCEQNFGDRHAVSEHLSRDHDALTRRDSKNKLDDQGFWWEKAVFICPICKFEIRIEYYPYYYLENKFWKHFKTHNLEERAENFQALVQAFVFSFGRHLSINTSLKKDNGDEEIAKFMTGTSSKYCLKHFK